MTDSSRSLLVGIGIVALCTIGMTVWVGTSIRALRGDLDASRKATESRMAAIGGYVERIHSRLTSVGKDPGAQAKTILVDEDVPTLAFKTDADAVAEIVKLKTSSDAATWARVIAEIDGWLFSPTEQDTVQTRLAKLIPGLRILVKQEVTTLQKAALSATPSAVGTKRLDEAGKILALYPMSDDPVVVKEAARLAESQMDAATRLDALRRQRYNKWAIGQIESAIDFYNNNVSHWNPLNDNTALLSPLVNSLGPVDPLYLEPVVLDLYNYIVDKMKGSLSEKNKLDFATKLTDPSIERKALGDL